MDLTVCEVRRLMEGHRVDERINKMAQDHRQKERAKEEGNLGKTVPRESDEEMLEEWQEKLDDGQKPPSGGV